MVLQHIKDYPIIQLKLGKSSYQYLWSTRQFWLRHTTRKLWRRPVSEKKCLINKLKNEHKIANKIVLKINTNILLEKKCYFCYWNCKQILFPSIRSENIREICAYYCCSRRLVKLVSVSCFWCIFYCFPSKNMVIHSKSHNKKN